MLNIIFSGIGVVFLGELFTIFFYIVKLSNHISEIGAKLALMEKWLERIENQLGELEGKK